MNENMPPLQLSNYFIEKLEYEALQGFNPATPAAEELVVDPDVYPIPNKPHDYMVRLRVSLVGSPRSNSRCRLHFSLVGFFHVAEQAPKKLRDQMVFGNAPLILFGIARQVAAETTANGPYGKVILGTVNFVEVLQRKAGSGAGRAAVEFKASDKPRKRVPKRSARKK